MTRRAISPEERLMLMLVVSLLIAAVALSPRRVSVSEGLAAAGFPFTYVRWQGMMTHDFSVVALLADVALPIGFAAFWIWRYVRSRG